MQQAHRKFTAWYVSAYFRCDHDILISLFVSESSEHLPRDQTNTQNAPSLRLDIAVLMVTELCCWVGVKGNVFDEREEEKEAECEADFEVSELRANVVKKNLEQCA